MDGRPRKSPDQILVGAEKTLGRMVAENSKTRQHSTASKQVNPDPYFSTTKPNVRSCSPARSRPSLRSPRCCRPSGSEQVRRYCMFARWGPNAVVADYFGLVARLGSRQPLGVPSSPPLLEGGDGALFAQHLRRSGRTRHHSTEDACRAGLLRTIPPRAQRRARKATTKATLCRSTPTEPAALAVPFVRMGVLRVRGQMELARTTHQGGHGQRAVPPATPARKASTVGAPFRGSFAIFRRQAHGQVRENITGQWCTHRVPRICILEVQTASFAEMVYGSESSG